MAETILNPKDFTLFLTGVSKTFGLSRALDNVNLMIKPGEIHGLLGQNGCGKSTLIKILAGFHQPDRGGSLHIGGHRVRLPLEPGEYNQYGMSFVHQDLGMISSLTVFENLRIKQITSKHLHINWAMERKRSRQILNRYNLVIDLDAPVDSLGQVEKAMLAIVRAVDDIQSNAKAKGSGLLILDEPTVFLPQTEVDKLFALIREVAAEGISVLFVSHDLDEVMEITDAVTVLRDGKNSGEAVTEQITKDRIIEMILGKNLTAYEMTQGEIRTAVSRDSIRFEEIKGEILKGVNFDVRPGEVVGLTGLVGSGFGELPYVLVGTNKQRSGRIVMENRDIKLESFSPQKAVRDKIALIPADRPNKGGIRDLQVEENLMMQVHYKHRPWNLKKKRMYKESVNLIRQYEVHPDDPNMQFGQLSGGNQQKVLLAKWLQDDPRLLILHEPTQGVDIGARQQVFKNIDNAAKKGTAVLCASSDYEQLAQICDRVLIFVKGRIIKELKGIEITKERITRFCFESA